MAGSAQFNCRRSSALIWALCGISALLFSGLRAQAQGVPIEFSAPKSDAVISNIVERNRSSTSVLDDIHDDIFSPLFKPDSSGSLGPVLSAPSPRIVMPSQRVRELQDQKRNWLMMNPDEYLRKSTGAEDRGFSKQDEDNPDEPELTIYERYYLEMRDRESKPPPTPATAQIFSPADYGRSISGLSEDVDPILQSFGQPPNPLSELFKTEDVPTSNESFGDAALTDPRRLGGAFSPNLIGNPLRQERLDAFQQLLRPEQELVSPLDSFRNMLNPSAELNTTLDQKSGLGEASSVAIKNQGQLSEIGSLNQRGDFNSAFKTPDPFEVPAAFRNPNVGAFGQLPEAAEAARPPSPKAAYAPLVLPIPKRDF